MAIEPIERVGKRLMFENDRVRVWDLTLEPGESFQEHLHTRDYLIIVESGGLIQFDEPEGPRDVQYEDDRVSFREVGQPGKVDHRLTNIGSKRHRNFIIELKSS